MLLISQISFPVLPCAPRALASTSAVVFMLRLDSSSSIWPFVKSFDLIVIPQPRDVSNPSEEAESQRGGNCLVRLSQGEFQPDAHASSLLVPEFSRLSCRCPCLEPVLKEIDHVFLSTKKNCALTKCLPVTVRLVQALHQRHESWLCPPGGLPADWCGTSPPKLLIVDCDREFEDDSVRRAELLHEISDFLTKCSEGE